MIAAIVRWWRTMVEFFTELSLERRRIEIKKLFRQRGWEPTRDECGRLEKVVYGDRKAYPESGDAGEGSKR